MHKYMTTPNTIYCEFSKSTTHATNQCRALDMLDDRLDQKTFKINETPQGLGRGHGGGVGGGLIGGRNGGRGSIQWYK
jgi:hypothetical protein